MPETSAIFNGHFLKSPRDVMTVEAKILPVRNRKENNPITVNLFPDSIPGFDCLTEKDVRQFRTTTRSRLGQSGIHVVSEKTIENLAKDFEGIKRRLLYLGETEFEAVVENWRGGRVEIPPDFGVFRFYYKDGAQKITGEDLREAVRSDRITISGREGEDWKFSRLGLNYQAVEFGIDPLSWRYHCCESLDQVFEVPTEKSYRTRIDEATIPLVSQEPPRRQKLLWICESVSNLKIAETDINALVPDWLVSNGHPTKHWTCFIPHTNAVVVDGGHTNWRIRFEIYCSLDQLPKWVKLDFFQDRRH